MSAHLISIWALGCFLLLQRELIWEIFFMLQLILSRKFTQRPGACYCFQLPFNTKVSFIREWLERTRWWFLECPIPPTSPRLEACPSIRKCGHGFVWKEGACIGRVMPGKGCSWPVHTWDSCWVCTGTSLRPLTVPAGTGAPVPEPSLMWGRLQRLLVRKSMYMAFVLWGVSLPFPGGRK